MVICTSKSKVGPLLYGILEYKCYILALSRQTYFQVCTQNNKRKHMMLRGLKVPQAYLHSWPDIPHLLECNWRVPHINHSRSAVCMVNCHIDRTLTIIGSSLHHKATHISTNGPWTFVLIAPHQTFWMYVMGRHVYGVFCIWKSSWPTLCVRDKAFCGNNRLWSEPVIKCAFINICTIWSHQHAEPQMLWRSLCRAIVIITARLSSFKDGATKGQVLTSSSPVSLMTYHLLYSSPQDYENPC